MKETMTSTPITSVVQALEQQSQIESLQYLISKLPALTDSLQAIEGVLSFITESLKDTESLSRIVNDIEGKVPSLHINQSHIDAMFILVQKLPNLVPMIEKVEEFGLFASSVLTDKQSVQYFLDKTSESLHLQSGIDIIQETNKRFKEREKGNNISLMGMLRLLKDPSVQKGLKYTESLLMVINERSRV